MSFGHFDEYDVRSWYFGALSNQEAANLLEDEETGTFLLRDSSSFHGEFVLCVKEKTGVVQYVIHRKGDAKLSCYLREEMCFPDLSSLLRFYKKNLLGTTPLIKPTAKEMAVQYRNNRPSRSPREVQSYTAHPASQFPSHPRASAPAGLAEYESEQLLRRPIYARVLKGKSPSAYDERALELRPGDIIKVTKKCSSGKWTGILAGKEGSFPFANVEIINEDN